ncbi:MAG TPA: undecaprenyl-diphosphate phosphatase, partial [Syntrophales bacterium]|nr:undecaprenyl-diphosphate phosphatase [Syntrophales bacterium]
MSFPEAVFLGILQGLTEFLPVSSSGHLVIAQGFLPGFEQPGVLFDLVLHGGTLVAVVFFLRKELSEMLRALIPLPPGEAAAEGESGRAVHRKMFLLIVAATFVTALVGWPFRDRIAGLFTSPTAAAFLLLVTGLLLFFADRVQNTMRAKKDLNIFDALIIGFA